MKHWPLVGVLAVAMPLHLAHAQDYPVQDDICVSVGNQRIVDKQKLAKAFINQSDAWRDLYMRSYEPENAPPSGPLWRRMFTDQNFCTNNPGCISLNPKTKLKDDSVAQETLDFLRVSFAQSLITQTGAGKRYMMEDPTIGERYFNGPNTQHKITCVGGNWPVAVKPPPGIKVPVRLRASSDDLGIDASKQKDAFKGVKPAIASFSREGVDTRTNTLKMQATLGYPIPIEFVKQPAFMSYFDAELVPYVSANQTVTKVDGKARIFNASNNVAAGALLNAQMMFFKMPGVNHVFLTKPQYLWNTKDHSEIASLKFIYQPWTVGPAPMVNTPFPVRTGVADTWIQFLFDLRFLSGTYVDKGNDPATIAKHVSFSRAGTRIGAVITTPAFGPHATLSVTETLLYGLSGELKYLSLFESVLSFYFDSTNNLAFTVSYKAGRDENTAERAQSLTAGFSAKF